jgi:hypothetical protein
MQAILVKDELAGQMLAVMGMKLKNVLLKTYISTFRIKQMSLMGTSFADNAMSFTSSSK